MNKRELIETIAQEAELSKKDAEKALDAVLGGIQGALKKGDRVQLTGFGSFEIRKRAARTAKNPQTGETVKVKATKVPAFKPGKAFKEVIAKSRPKKK